jgi:hypothetical protein
MRRVARIAAAAAAMGALLAASGSAQNTEQLDISAFAISMGTVATGANQRVQIRINKWSTPEEREHLINVMLEKGPNDLLRALQKESEKGRFSIPGLRGPDPHNLRLGHDLRYTWQSPLPDGGRRIVVITDRYIGFQEARNQPRSMDYPFTLIEMRVNKDGKGEGKMAVATKITFDKKEKRVELENYSSEPVRLNALEVKVRS